MATDNKTAAVESKPKAVNGDYYEEKVPVRLFKDTGKYQDDVFVAVNGKGWLIQRGVTVEVPRYVAEVLEQSMDQDQRAAELMERRAGEFAAQSKALGI